MFAEMVSSIKSETAKAVLTVSVKRHDAFARKEVANVKEGRTESKKKATAAPARRAAEPDRNAPCPCGSGKKYKKCCALKKDGDN